MMTSDETNINEPTPTPEEGGEAQAGNPNFQWFVVHTYSGYENRAKASLIDRIGTAGLEAKFGEILVPTENVVEMKQGSKRTSKRKIFPGYIIVQMELDNETWNLVKTTPKITDFVGANTRRPRPISEREVRKITQQMDEGTARPKPKATFEKGTQVRVIDGPFVNFAGTVEEVRPDKQKLIVLVSIFGRATPVELDFMQVERLA